MQKLRIQKLTTLVVLCATAWLCACGAKLPSLKPFKIDVQQGNEVTSKMLLQLRPGMTKSQVRYIMGTPLVVDGFHQDRWDYFYSLSKQGKLIEKRRVILDFENDALLRVRGDVVPEGDASAKAEVTIQSVAETEKVSKVTTLDNATVEGVTQQSAESKKTVKTVENQKLTESASMDDSLSNLQNIGQKTESFGNVVSTAVQETLAPGEILVTDMEADASALPQSKDVESSVMAWAEAWRSKNIDTYLAAYASAFKPEGNINRQQWETERKKRLTPKQGDIDLRVSNLQIQENGQQATVRFEQTYRSKTYSDRVIKQLVMQQNKSRTAWLIVREIAINNVANPRETKVFDAEDTQ